MQKFQFILPLGLLYFATFSYANTEPEFESAQVVAHETNINSHSVAKVFVPATPSPSYPWKKYETALNEKITTTTNQPISVQFEVNPTHVQQFNQLLKKQNIIIQEQLGGTVLAQLTAKQLKSKSIADYKFLIQARLQQVMVVPNITETVLIYDNDHTEKNIEDNTQNSSQSLATHHLNFTSSQDMTMELLAELASQNKKNNIIVSPQSLTEMGIGLLMANSQPKKLKRPKWFLTKVAYIEENDTPSTLTKNIFQSWNKVWYNDQYTINSEFNQNYTDLLAGQIQPIHDIQPEILAKKINTEIAQQTEQHIQHLLNAEDFTHVEAILSNVAYLKADWKNKFNKSYTKMQEFNNLDETKSQVLMLNQKINVATSEYKGWTLVDMPFSDEKSDVILLLTPENKTNKIPTLKQLEKLDATKKTEKIILSLPKIKLTGEPIQMQQVIPKFHTWQLDKLVNNQILSKLKGVHQASIEWDEDGATAGAATVVMASKGLDNTPEIRFNRPFFFLIRQGQHILFAGTIRQLDNVTK